ncbi:MAG: metallophosphoesterase family protein [Alphaproteobacteria bacterium]
MTGVSEARSTAAPLTARKRELRNSVERRSRLAAGADSCYHHDTQGPGNVETKGMFSKLFGGTAGARAGAPKVPDGTRVYVVGDVHGRADLLRQLHGQILEHAKAFAGGRKAVVYLGDYVDRGLQSREVIELLLDEPLAGFEAVYLKGNHEQFLLEFLADASIGPTWMFNGGDATLYSYKVGRTGLWSGDEALRRLQADFRANLPERHLEFVRSLDLSHVEGDYLFVHAGIRPGVPFEEQKEFDLLWIREEFLHSQADYGRVVVHGHTIVPDPEIRANRIGVDTGAFASGRLTCLVLEGESRTFLQT